MSIPIGKYDQVILGSPLLTGVPRVGSEGGVYYGRTTVGSVRNNITATAAAADSLIFLTLQNIVVGSEARNPDMVVVSVNPGVGFVAGTVSSINFANSYTLTWLIVNPQT